jgi:poly-gamma-glutamate synthesis protein (capsule biosynthesis protein)
VVLAVIALLTVVVPSSALAGLDQTGAAPNARSAAQPAVSPSRTAHRPPTPAPPSSHRPPAPPKAPAAPPRQFTLIAAGDVLLHNSLWAQAAAAARAAGRPGYDFDPALAALAPDVAGADLAICHLETPLGNPTGPFSGYPSFNVPPQIATTLRTIGYDDCDTASNHTLDQGYAGVSRTLAALDAAGISHTGSARSAADAARLDLIRVNGVTVAHLAYTFSFNGIPLPASKPWLANLIDVPRILADAHRAKLAGADVVVISLHWGTEYVHAPNSYQRRIAAQLLASPDIDLLLGCHAHVVQPFARSNGKWVVYGMGNQIAWQPTTQDTRDGVMARFTFTEVAPGRFQVTRAEAIPTYVWFDHGTATVIDLPRALADPTLPPLRRAAFLASWQRSADQVSSASAAGLVVVGQPRPSPSASPSAASSSSAVAPGS